MWAAASVVSSSLVADGITALEASALEEVSAGCIVPGSGLGVGDVWPSPVVDTAGTEMPIVTLTAVSSSVGTASASGSVTGWASRRRLRAALRSALPILTSRTLTVAGSSPKTFWENTRNTSTRSSPCSWSSRDFGESGRMKVRDSPSAVLYVPANSSTFSPLSPQRIARKLENNVVVSIYAPAAWNN